MNGARFICAAALVVACGSESGDGNDAGGDAIADGSSDVTSKTDAAFEASTTDAGADATTDAKPPIALSLKCAESDQCEAGTPVCCATLDFGNDCILDSVATSCAAASDCPTTIQPFCAKTETVRFCAGNVECAEPSYDKCCTFQITGYAQSIVMCASQQMAEAVDASCTDD